MCKVIAIFGFARTIIETDNEIIVVGHQNAGGEYPEERFSKKDHFIEKTKAEFVIHRRT